MKNNLFRKATVLVIGSLMVFSGQALAISSNNQELTTTDDALGNSKSVIAQGVSIVAAVSIAVQALDQAVTVVRTAAVQQDIPPELRDIVLPKLQAAQGSLASAESSAQKGDNVAVAKAIATAISTIGNSAQAVATADAGSAQAIAEVIATAQQAQALAQGQASSQPK